MPKTIERLLAEAEIRDVQLRYCRANDCRDEELMRDCFHPDAVIELHESLTVDAFIALGRTILGRYVVTWHNTGNQLVEVHGDGAWAEHYTISTHRIAADEKGPERLRGLGPLHRPHGATRWRMADCTANDARGFYTHRSGPNGRAGVGQQARFTRSKRSVICLESEELNGRLEGSCRLGEKDRRLRRASNLPRQLSRGEENDGRDARLIA
jgi:SnoaL-like domain